MENLLKKIKLNKTVALILAALVVYHIFLASIYEFIQPYTLYMAIGLAFIFIAYLYVGSRNKRNEGAGKTYMIGILMFLPILGMSQDVPPEEYAKNDFIAAMKMVWQYIDWVYIVIYMALTWIITDVGAAKNKAQKLNWLQKIPNLLKAAIVAVFVGAVLIYFFRLNTREDIFTMFFSAVVGMVIYKVGIKQVFDWISKRWLGIEK